MHLEIERRFLASFEVLELCREGTPIVQGYLRADQRLTVRVRVAGEQAFVTIKGPRSGLARLEHETRISLTGAAGLLARIPSDQCIEKTRYRIVHGQRHWEVDVFEGGNAGLILAEIEMDDPGESIDLPPWVEAEVTHDPRYSNSHLARSPLGAWSQAA